MPPPLWGALIGGTLTEVGHTGERASLPHPLNISGHNSLFPQRTWGPLKCMAPILPLAAPMRDCVRISRVVNDVHNQRRKAIASASASVEAGGIAHTSALDNDGAEVLWG